MYRVISVTPFEPKDNYDLSKLNDVSILIKTLERKEHLVNQIYSVQKYGFRGPVIIADDSRQPYKKDVLGLFPDMNITYLELPYDTGTAEGRNLMLGRTTTPYFVLCDDDFIFEARTRIPLMRKMLIENELDIVGGVFLQYNLKTRKGKYLKKLSDFFLKFNAVLPSVDRYEYFGNFEIEGDVIRLNKVKYHEPFTICDLTHNFFIARTDKVKSFGGWNSILKGGEHQNFFIRAKLNGLKVATTRKCGVIHDRWTKNSEEYVALRARGNDYQNLALAEFGFKRIENYGSVLGGKFGT